MLNEIKHIPKNSRLSSGNQDFDYWDCFQGDLIVKENLITPTAVCIAFLSSAREEAQKLLRVKDKVSSTLSFKAPKKNIEMRNLNSYTYETGEQLELLKVFYRNNKEIVLGANRKRFDFRISLLLEDVGRDTQKALAFTTTVVYHDWLGRSYFFLIKPFHKFMAKRLLKSAIKKIENSII